MTAWYSSTRISAIGGGNIGRNGVIVADIHIVVPSATRLGPHGVHGEGASGDNGHGADLHTVCPIGFDCDCEYFDLHELIGLDVTPV